MQQLNETCTSTQRPLEFTQKGISDVENQNAVLQRENAELVKRVTRLERKDRERDCRMGEIKGQIAGLDNKQRARNVIREGINQTDGENHWAFSKASSQISPMRGWAQFIGWVGKIGQIGP